MPGAPGHDPSKKMGPQPHPSSPSCLVPPTAPPRSVLRPNKNSLKNQRKVRDQLTIPACDLVRLHPLWTEQLKRGWRRQSQADCKRRGKDRALVREKLLLPEWSLETSWSLEASEATTPPPDRSRDEDELPPPPQFADKSGRVFARGYRSVLYGDHGAYLELAEEHFASPNVLDRREAAVKRGTYYDVVYLVQDVGFPEEVDGEPGSSRLEFYLQKNAVTDKPNPPSGRYTTNKDRAETGYAAYKPGFFYVSVRKIAVIWGDPDSGDPQLPLTTADLRWREGDTDTRAQAVESLCSALGVQRLRADYGLASAKFETPKTQKNEQTSDELQRDWRRTKTARGRSNKRESAEQLCRRLSLDPERVLCGLLWRISSAEAASPDDDTNPVDYILTLRTAASPKVDDEFLRTALERCCGGGLGGGDLVALKYDLVALKDLQCRAEQQWAEEQGAEEQWIGEQGAAERGAEEQGAEEQGHAAERCKEEQGAEEQDATLGPSDGPPSPAHSTAVRTDRFANAGADRTAAPRDTSRACPVALPFCPRVISPVRDELNICGQNPSPVEDASPPRVHLVPQFGRVIVAVAAREGLGGTGTSSGEGDGDDFVMHVSGGEGVEALLHLSGRELRACLRPVVV